jgi:pyrimidine operon attenuation protein / uracil phosphoribosyltransferase
MPQLPDANTLFAALIEQMAPHVNDDTALVGIYTGGAWLAEQLHEALGIRHPLGTIDVSFYRDDYAAKGLHPQLRRSDIPFDMEGRSVILVDDVLFTGRTTRAALNELFDYGRPARVDLAVLVDRGERQLPIAARVCGHTLATPLDGKQNLQLEKADNGSLSLRLIDA